MQEGHGDQRRPEHGTWLRSAGVTLKLQGGSKRREVVVGGRGGVMVVHPTAASATSPEPAESESLRCCNYSGKPGVPGVDRVSSACPGLARHRGLFLGGSQRQEAQSICLMMTEALILWPRMTGARRHAVDANPRINDQRSRILCRCTQ